MGRIMGGWPKENKNICSSQLLGPARRRPNHRQLLGLGYSNNHFWPLPFSHLALFHSTLFTRARFWESQTWITRYYISANLSAADKAR